MRDLQSATNLQLNFISISFFVNYCNSSPKIFLIQTEDKKDAGKAKAKVKKEKKKAKDPVHLGKGSADYIVGGQEAAPHQFPWQISLFQNNMFICGATIVDSTHVLSAAHCIQGRQKSQIKVAAGAHNININLSSGFGEGVLNFFGKILSAFQSPPMATNQERIQIRNVAKMWVHDGYGGRISIFSTDHSNDVSLLKLDQPLEFNEYVQPLPMAPKGDDPAGGIICAISGWGSTSQFSFWPSMPSKLQYVEMPIVSRPDCQTQYSVKRVDEGMICAGIGVGGVSACDGDSGGPFACPNENGTLYLAGIASWVLKPCGQANRPTVFTRVGYFRDWIDQHLDL